MSRTFFYGLYKGDSFKSKSGEIMTLSDYERGAIERGAEFIALHRPKYDETLDGWCYLICGECAEELMDHCRVFWDNMCLSRFGLIRYHREWLLRRLDHAEFNVIDYSQWDRPYIAINSRLFS